MLLVLLVAAGWSGTAGAGADIDFGVAIRAGDDTELFMAISSRYFGRDPGDVRDWRARYRDPDDAAVALFLAGRSGTHPEVVFQLRSGGLSWWEVGRRLDVQPEAWFVPCSYRPGPPYGRAYGFWRKYESNHKYRFELMDREVRDLVAVRMLHDYYGMSPAVAMKWRSGQQDVQSLMAREYRKRHPPEHADRPDGGRHHGDRGEGHSKHGGGKSHGR
ncbi:MAG: hypothetical protein Q7W29_07125 [bacterium]|nr:hypothetical protein [bacterium]